MWRQPAIALLAPNYIRGPDIAIVLDRGGATSYDYLTTLLTALYILKFLRRNQS